MTKDIDTTRGIPLPPDADIRSNADIVAEYAMDENLDEICGQLQRLERLGLKAEEDFWEEIAMQNVRAAFDMEITRQLIEEGYPDRAAALLHCILAGLGVHPNYFADDHARRREQRYLNYAAEIESASRAAAAVSARRCAA